MSDYILGFGNKNNAIALGEEPSDFGNNPTSRPSRLRTRSAFSANPPVFVDRSGSRLPNLDRIRKRRRVDYKDKSEEELRWDYQQQHDQGAASSLNFGSTTLPVFGDSAMLPHGLGSSFGPSAGPSKAFGFRTCSGFGFGSCSGPSTPPPIAYSFCTCSGVEALRFGSCSGPSTPPPIAFSFCSCSGVEAFGFGSCSGPLAHPPPKCFSFGSCSENLNKLKCVGFGSCASRSTLTRADPLTSKTFSFGTCSGPSPHKAFGFGTSAGPSEPKAFGFGTSSGPSAPKALGCVFTTASRVVEWQGRQGP